MAPTPDASDGVATPPYRAHSTITISARNGRILGRMTSFSRSVKCLSASTKL